jgi:tetratricopeptide (TPR) repeat protein
MKLDSTLERRGPGAPKRTNNLMRATLSSVLLLSLVLASCGGGHYGRTDQPASQLAFGVDMAKRGLWNEALFRFHQAEQLDPQNPRVLNNLGVAYEASGEYDKALSYYQRALKAAPENRELRANYGRFVEFYQSYKGRQDNKPGQPAAKPDAAVPGSAPAPGRAPRPAPPPPGASAPPMSPTFPTSPTSPTSPEPSEAETPPPV